MGYKILHNIRVDAMDYALTVYDYVFEGSLKHGGSWGGAECAKYISFIDNIGESIMWLVITAIVAIWGNAPGVLSFIFTEAKKEIAVRLPYRSTFQMIFDRILGSLMFTIWLFLIFYKWNTKSLNQLLQPCHIILLFQAMALSSDGPWAVMLSLFQLPLLSHTLALVVPDTTGLDQPLERDLYWYQHYLTAIVPLYLLMRHSYLVLDFHNKYSWVANCCVVVVVHFGFYSFFDFIFSVNVQFMLCPTAGIRDALSLVPSGILWPTYRSPLCIVSCLYSYIFTVAYTSVVKFIRDGTFREIPPEPVTQAKKDD
jgi:hypothetical protein